MSMKLFLEVGSLGDTEWMVLFLKPYSNVGDTLLLRSTPQEKDGNSMLSDIVLLKPSPKFSESDISEVELYPLSLRGDASPRTSPSLRRSGQLCAKMLLKSGQEARSCAFHDPPRDKVPEGELSADIFVLAFTARSKSEHERTNEPKSEHERLVPSV